MTSDRVLDRIRAANPAPATIVSNDELFAWIIASRGDPRLAVSAGTTGGRRPRWLRRGARPLAFLAVAIVLCAAGGALGAVELGLFSHASPKALFRANPAGRFPGAPRQVVIPHTVHRATTFTIPGVGTFEWWIALSKKGWLCEAIRQPDGTWADLGVNDKFQVSGPAPGCGGFPWHDVDGYAYEQTSIHSPGEQTWRVSYGYVPTTGNPVKVRDKISGATAPIEDGRYFAIVMPLCKGANCEVPKNAPPGPYLPGYQLEALNSAGRVLSTDRFDPGM
jgi:hypothetical protein